MIRIKRGGLPAGAQAIALRQDSRIVVYVSEDLSGRQRLAAFREALNAAPAAGWRSTRSPVLLPALAMSAGLRQVPEGRWSYRMAVAAVAGGALLITATGLGAISVKHGGEHQPAAAGLSGPPLIAAWPATGQAAAGRRSDPGRQPGNGSSPAQPGTAPKPGKTTTTSAGGGAAPPTPRASRTPAPVPTRGSSPRPSQTPWPSPSPSP